MKEVTPSGWKQGLFGCVQLVLIAAVTLAAVLAALFYDGEAAHELHDAAAKGELSRVRALLDGGTRASVRIRDFNLLSKRDAMSSCTPIVCSVRSEHFELVELLLQRGADIDARGWREKTALIMSARNSSPEVTLGLLNAGADLSLCDESGLGALEEAMLVGGVHVGMALFEASKSLPTPQIIVRRALERAHGAADFNRNPHTHTFTSVFDTWLRETEGHAHIPLHAATRSGSSIESLSAMLKTKLNLEQRDSCGWTALMWAAGVDGGDSKLDLLLRAGADPNGSSPKGWTALLGAAEAGAQPRVAKLLEAGADVYSTETVAGHSALHLALYAYLADPDLSSIRALVQAGADLQLEDKSGVTPLSMAQRWAKDARGLELLAVLENSN